MLKRFLYKSYCFFHTFRCWRKQRFTAAGQVVAIAISTSALLGLDTRQSVIYQIFTFLLPLLLIAMVWSLFFRARFKVDRKLPRFATAGESFTYHIDISNLTPKMQKGLFLFEDADNPLPSFENLLNGREPGEEKRNIWDRKVLYHRWLWLTRKNQRARVKEQPIPPLAPHEKGRITAGLHPRRRGYLNLTSTTITRTDPFGLFRATRTVAKPQRILVLPKRYPLPPIDLPGTHKHHSGGVALASSVGNSNEFVSLRDYRPGDPIKQIHWKSSAKTNELILKEFEDEFFVRHALILDTFQDRTHSQVFEEAVSIAASFICGLHHQETLLDLMFVGAQAHCISSGRGLAHTDQMMEILAVVSPCTDKPFSTLLPIVVRHAPLLSGCICILLGWDEKRRTLIRHLKTMGIPVKAMVIRDSAIDGPAIDPGPMKDDLKNFHVLETDNIQEGLSGI